MKKKTFADLIAETKEKPTPLQAFVEECAEVVRCSPITVRRWIWGVSKPDYATCKLLADHFKVDPDGLFPN